MLNKTKIKIAGGIWEEIKRAKRVLLTLHVAPDPDSVASTLAMDLVLRRMGKRTKIISYSALAPDLFHFPRALKIEIIDPVNINFKRFDCLIALDTMDEKRLTRSNYPKRFPKGFKVINIDHHFANSRFGHLNLISRASSVAEMVTELFDLWGIKIDRYLARLLLWGIYSDSLGFQVPKTSEKAFRVAAKLLEKGATLEEVVFQCCRSYEFKTLKYWGRILKNLKLDESGKFIWATFSEDDRRELGIAPTAITGATALFAPVVLGTEFGIILNEENENLTRGSLRSRADFDVSKIAQELGGGGHKGAAGFSLALPLKEAEKKVLEVVRRRC